jgi:hypothetical protein
MFRHCFGFLRAAAAVIIDLQSRLGRLDGAFRERVDGDFGLAVHAARTNERVNAMTVQTGEQTSDGPDYIALQAAQTAESEDRKAEATATAQGIGKWSARILQQVVALPFALVSTSI